MAVYKVIQDVEADDKFLGPLSFKQFIFGGIAAVAIYLCFLAVTKNLWPLLIVFLPIVAVAGFLAWPWGRDQPTEIWLAAQIRFLIKPRKRIWNQMGLKQLVTITAPKREQKVLTKDFTGEEASSRLSALASMLDSRGWAIKNSNVSLPVDASVSQPLSNTDRLLENSTRPKEVPEIEVTASDDIMDPTSNMVAQHFENMIQRSEVEHKHELAEKVTEAREHSRVISPDQAASGWFANQGVSASPIPAPLSGPTSADEQALLGRIHSSQAQAAQASTFGHLKTLQPLDNTQPVVSSTPVKPAIIQLAQNNDLNAEVLARQAKRDNDQHLPDNEVIVPLQH